MDVERTRELLAAERRELEDALSHRGLQDDNEIAGFKSRRIWPQSSPSTGSTRPSPPIFMNDPRLASVPSSDWRTGHTASRSRAVS